RGRSWLVQQETVLPYSHILQRMQGVPDLQESLTPGVLLALHALPALPGRNLRPVLAPLLKVRTPAPRAGESRPIEKSGESANIGLHSVEHLLQQDNILFVVPLHFFERSHAALVGIPPQHELSLDFAPEIGRASCRERV